MSDESNTVEDNIEDLIGAIDEKDNAAYQEIRASVNNSAPKLAQRERANSGPQP